MTSPVALCLACSSSPSPRAQSSAPFTTACCSRPICEQCLTKNPRLRGYNPCLACLAGVAVVDKSRAPNGKPRAIVPGPSGQSQEQEDGNFVLGDSDEEDPEDDTIGDREPLPAYVDEAEAASTIVDEDASTVADEETLVGDAASEVSREEGPSNPPQYYIRRGDTLMGIALKYGVDGHKVCQLNNLPISTLSTTPHLLHTRTSIILPPTRRPLQRPPTPPSADVLEARRRERAEKRFQFVTKEVDWRIAKAYVSLAEDEDDSVKTKEDLEGVRNQGNRVLEAATVDQYLDDGEWEARQSGGPRIEGFPPFNGGDNGKSKSHDRARLTSRLGKLISS